MNTKVLATIVVAILLAVGGFAVLFEERGSVEESSATLVLGFTMVYGAGIASLGALWLWVTRPRDSMRRFGDASNEDPTRGIEF